MYEKRAPAAELALLGVKPEDFKQEKLDLWPENWPAVEVLLRFQTQWRVGPAGAVGLDYGVIYPELDRLDLPSEERDDLMSAIRVLEAAALDEMHKD